MTGRVRRAAPRTAVAGIGNEYRRDDGVGVAVAAHVATHEPTVRNIGPVIEPLDLLTRWDGADLAVVIDAVCSHAKAGTVSIVDLDSEKDCRHVVSSHGIDLPGALRIARTVGQAPGRVVVVGVVGVDFSHGPGLSPDVEAAVPIAEQMVL